jgi:DNA replication initiation complex subunit (GINS family)
VAEEEGVSYEMLQDLLRAERRSNKLMPVQARFWPEVREFLQTLTSEFRIEQARDPFSRKVMLLSDQVKNAKHAAEAVWALRERKLAMLALAATKERKMPEGITPDEGALYLDLVRELEETRERVFQGTVAAPSFQPAPAPVPSAAPAPTAAPPVQMPVLERPAEVPAAIASPPQPGPPPASSIPPKPRAQVVTVPPDTKGAASEMVTIRALGDIPPFVGPDMQTYLLKAGDVATVPPSIATLLVRRNKAAVIEAT